MDKKLRPAKILLFRTVSVTGDDLPLFLCQHKGHALETKGLKAGRPRESGLETWVALWLGADAPGTAGTSVFELFFYLPAI
jgi:hypothetical protein